ncbi:hypothetical protein RUND412_005538 [Rhizina undulata]
MFISLPAPRISSPPKRRSPLTPPSVTPPAVSTTGSSTMQCERDRCKSPSQRASTLLARVAVVGSPPPTTAPSSPRMYSSTNHSSTDSTPICTPPADGSQFNFTASKNLPDSPDGGYISFPVFEEFGDYKSDDERDDESPPRKR